MYNHLTVAVLVPAHNEEKLIQGVLETIPEWVDHVLVVDDLSRDRTVERVEEFMRRDSRVKLIRHTRNLGVGGALATGYKACREQGFDITVVMNGDGQMHPEDLPGIVEPIAAGKADYTKGNRLFHGQAWAMIPRVRYLGNAVLSMLTKIASGYWHIADSQCGFTAISRQALEHLHLDRLFPRYGVPNDILVQLNIENQRVADVPIRPVYGIGEVSGMRIYKVIPDISWLLMRRFGHRLLEKYVIRDFHPLVFFYTLGLISMPLGGGLGIYYFFYRLMVGKVTPVSALFAAFLTLAGILFLMFAMLFDMENNRHLKGD
ncbi:MAG: glycosyltransferase family 2 protein [Nitrospinaceae bacterium]